MTRFKLEILSPEKTFFDGEVDSLIIETPNGQIGILAKHAPMAVGMQPGLIRFKVDGVEHIAANGEGFLEIRPDKTIVLCQTVDSPEEIEERVVERAILESQRRLREAKSQAEYKVSKANLARAFNKLRLLGK